MVSSNQFNKRSIYNTISIYLWLSLINKNDLASFNMKARKKYKFLHRHRKSNRRIYFSLYIWKPLHKYLEFITTCILLKLVENILPMKKWKNNNLFDTKFGINYYYWPTHVKPSQSVYKNIDKIRRQWPNSFDNK